MVDDVERGPTSGPGEEEGSAGRFFAPGWRVDDLILDPWSGLAHKEVVGPGSRGQIPNLAPTWVGGHARRLNAYRVLSAYLANVARAFLPTYRPYEDRAKFREYGDAATWRDQIRSSLLGDDPQFVVEHAGEEPEEPEAPVEPPPDATPDEKAAFDVQNKAHADALTEFEAAMREFEEASAFQEWLDEWVDDEKMILKVVETENDASGLGDGVYYLTWSNRKRRVRVHCYDPGFYFPVLNEDDDDYPERCHLAWQYDDDNGNQWVRRITFELVERDPGAGRYPWESIDDPPSEYRCVMTDARWRYDDLGSKTVDQFSLGKAEIRTADDGTELLAFDLGIDFIPLVHVPNTVSLKHHFGESSITRIAQILDDLGQTDTDLATSADLAGAPPIAVKGRGPADGRVVTYGPGTVFFGEGMDVLDTSRALDALLKRLESLLDRMSVNGRVPKELLGRVKMGEVASGIALLLTFGPFRSLINEMRLVRTEKYRLLLRMVQRLAMVGASGNGGKTTPGGTLKPGPVLNAELKFGSYIPTDTQALVTMLSALLAAHGISRLSVLRMLDEAGLDLGDDLNAELERIQHEDFLGAAEIANATADEADAAKYLGITPHPQAAVPPPGSGAAGGGQPVPGGGGTPAPPGGFLPGTTIPRGGGPAGGGPQGGGQ